jgi:hypothetical protein
VPEQTLGALLLMGHRGAFDAAAHRILGILANQASAVLALIRNVEDARDLALRDELTHLYNRRAFADMIIQAIAREDRRGGTFGLALLYLDGNKAVLYRSRMNPFLGRNFEAMDPLEWLARLADHIPDPGKHRTISTVSTPAGSGPREESKRARSSRRRRRRRRVAVRRAGPGSSSKGVLGSGPRFQWAPRVE